MVSRSASRSMFFMISRPSAATSRPLYAESRGSSASATTAQTAMVAATIARSSDSTVNRPATRQPAAPIAAAAAASRTWPPTNTGGRLDGS